MNLSSVIVPLFAPGNRPERFEKAAVSGADAIIIDLEDAVPAPSKTEARTALRIDFTSLPVLVRVNGENTPWHGEDIAAVARLRPAAVIFPKAELGGRLAEYAATCALPVLPLLETARGLSEARQIAALPGVARLIFGSIDYCADLGCSDSREALLGGRSELVLASRLAGLASPVDGVTMSIDDGEQIAADARYAGELGFGAKLAVHPRQIKAIKAGFRPQQFEIEWASKVLASGDGATAVNGAMVDEPVRIRARSIIARASLKDGPQS